MSRSNIDATQALSDNPDVADIASAVQAYVKSINDASVNSGQKIFYNHDSTIFIHPRGTERGWKKISSDIYEFFDETFIARDLKVRGAPNIHLHGDTAVVDFEWDFVATFRENGEPLHTTGRESQIYRKFAGEGWRIIHVHYSGPPVTTAGQGF